MSIRTILAAAGGGTATVGTIELACGLARRFDAHLEVLHVRPDRNAVLVASGETLGGPGSAALVDTVIAEAQARAAMARGWFDEIAARHGLQRDGAAQSAPRQPSANWREDEGDAAMLTASHGRFHDLVVLGASERAAQEPHSDTIEQVLLGCGRPVLLAPPEPSASGVGKAVAIAWNGSPQAVRALAAALPFLAAAGAVSLLTAGDGDGSVGPALDYLGWHGIKAEPRQLAAAAGRHVGQALIAAAKEAGADLLVMGAYGQATWREQLFGGATSGVLATNVMPLFLMH